MIDSNGFSERYRFADWPNAHVPSATAGVYAIWHGSVLMYCGMSGRKFDPIAASKRRRAGLITRLHSHASGKLSGDQFCVYVANRLILPALDPSQLPGFGTGAYSLDRLTRTFIREHLEYQYACVASSEDAFALEAACLAGTVFGQRPFLNPPSERRSKGRRPKSKPLELQQHVLVPP